ncbi:hypothetical protein [Kribbella sp. NPDC051770]|uniref:hypothetical protein n=1 Tax=Kribbella sp. NPDC051770 TaxID=3155413 RepID=UPI003415769F
MKDCQATSFGCQPKPSAADITTAFEQCAEALRLRLAAEGHHAPAVFYVWHDEMAGQLRCSTTSYPADQLPFGCTVVPTTLESIAADFLRAPGYIPWSDLHPADNEDDEDTREWTVEVWTTPVT